MKKGTKLLSLALVLAMVLSMAAGLAAQAEDRVTITYSMWGDSEEVRVLEETIKKFEDEQDKIHVEVVQIDRADYVGALNTRAAGNNLPDTGIMAEDAVLMWAEQGMLADVSNMYGADEAKPLDSLAFTFNGSPVGYSVSNEVLLTFYDRKAFADAGVASPPASADQAWDWDTFVDVAKQMTLDVNGNNAKSPDFDPNNIKRYGVMFCPDFWQLEVWSVTNGGAWYDAEGNVTINTPEATEALQRIADLSLVHHVAPQYGTNTATTIDQDLVNGNTAMYIQGQWAVGVWLGNAHQSDGLDYGVGVLPYMQDKATLNTGGVNVAFATSQHPTEAMEWLKWYAKEENSWGLIESGIWMPVLSSYYTDEALTHKWVDNPNFPPYDEYKAAVVDYAMNNAQPTSWYWVNNTNLFNDALSTILAPCWSGNAKVADVIAQNIDALKAANQGN
ncbi:MAG: sugar ABC transporter substrate-binding protein [Oscillospiraceae bacterium]|jgi:multiple sugar transport system substrate-binding protein|nr:sugar ABC transporter substrate-binding protein [Oscillospiraceae bacterium]